MSRIDVAGNLAAVQERIAAACLQAGRTPEEVGLVAVSKRIDTDLVVAGMKAGQVLLGENRMPEAMDRRPVLDQALAEGGLQDLRPVWHFIGHIQSRKAAQVVGNFELLHGVDSVKLAGRLSQACVARGVNQPILLEVNVTGEEQKYGFAPDLLVDALGEIQALPGLEVQGLMCMARFGADEAEWHGTYAGLRKLAEEGRRQLESPLPVLSMGMSGDFEIAIAEGATLVRVGGAIFGPRNP